MAARAPLTIPSPHCDAASIRLLALLSPRLLLRQSGLAESAPHSTIPLPKTVVNRGLAMTEQASSSSSE